MRRVFAEHTFERNPSSESQNANGLPAVLATPAGSAHKTDVTNASRTCLMDLKTCRWHAATAAQLGIPLEALPSIHSCAEARRRGGGAPAALAPRLSPPPAQRGDDGVVSGGETDG